LTVLVDRHSVNEPSAYRVFDAGLRYDHYPELAGVDGLSDFIKRGRERDPKYAPKTAITYINYSPKDFSKEVANLQDNILIQAFASRDFPSFLEEDAFSSTRDMRQRGFIQAVIGYDDICRPSLSPKRVGFQEYFNEVKKVEVDYILNTITKYYDWNKGDSYYMEPRYLPLFESLWRTERLEIIAAVFKTLPTLGSDGSQNLIDSAMSPLLKGVKLRNDIKTFYRRAGCAVGGEFVRNWFDYLTNDPPVRADNAYPTKKTEFRGLAKYFVAEVPSDVVPHIAFVEGQPMTVYIDRRTTGDGLSSYEAGGFHLGLLPGRSGAFVTPQESKLYDEMQSARARILSCAYANGTRRNFWLAGFPLPSEDLRQRAGPSFVGVAAQCPAR